MFLYTGYGYIVTLPELPLYTWGLLLYTWGFSKKCGCFPFSPGASAMFLVFIPWHLPPPGLCLAHHLVVSRCHPSVASLFGACSCGTASVSWTPGLMAVRSDWRCAVLNVQCSVYIYIYIRETIYNKKI
jgi:hypothetical protein